jgi:hypothetical protein
MKKSIHRRARRGERVFLKAFSLRALRASVVEFKFFFTENLREPRKALWIVVQRTQKSIVIPSECEAI